jgi:hypothetical protein
MDHLSPKQALFEIVHNLISPGLPDQIPGLLDSLTFKHKKMKSVLYVGATLMIGASIYGFIDYQKTSHSREFTRMYKDQANPDPVIDHSSQTLTSPVVEKQAATVTKQTITPVKTVQNTVTRSHVHKRRFSTNLFSRAPLEERYIDKQTPKAEIKEE